MESTVVYVTALVILASALAAYQGVHRTKVINQIRGPPSPSWIFGHMRQLLFTARYGEHEFAWQKLYGPIYRIRGCFRQERLMVADPVALQYLLNNPDMFFKAPVVTGIITSLAGKKRDEHRRLRAALNIGFTSAAVRSYQSVFEKTAEMVSDLFEKSTADVSTDVSPLLSTGTLAAITEAVLGSSIEDLGRDFVENNIRIMRVVSYSLALSANFEGLPHSELTASQSDAQLLVDGITEHLPSWIWEVLMHLPTTAAKVLRKQRYLTARIGVRAVREKVEAASKGLEVDNDVFSRLLNPDAPDNNKKLSAHDVAAQTAVILLAGQETTANSTAFGLLMLARLPRFQDELRAEIHSTIGAGTRKAGYDGMPLLNAFIKEVLRYFPAVPLSDRIVSEDTVIPLSEPITTATGERLDKIPVKKGQIVTMAIAAYQRLPSRWGEDADEFNPARWLDGRTYQGEALGPYGNLLSFFGGSRVCLGWRFVILEMQVLLCELVGKFSFAEPEAESVRARFINFNLLPITANGDRALPLRITRVS
ncbi:cytochrome P450 [Mycena polygramma]|nr:cytochrome P450 [Mycena polygramma]